MRIISYISSIIITFFALAIMSGCKDSEVVMKIDRLHSSKFLLKFEFMIPVRKNVLINIIEILLISSQLL